MKIVKELILGLMREMKCKAVHAQPDNLVQSSKVPISEPVTVFLLQLKLLAVYPVLIGISHDKHPVNHSKIKQIFALFMDLSVPSQLIYLFKLGILISQEEWVDLILVFLVIHVEILAPLVSVGWDRFRNFIYNIHFTKIIC